MSITVKIPAQLRGVTGGESEVEVEGGTVGEALDAVFDQHHELRERITDDGSLRRFVNVYVSGEDIRFRDGLDTALADGDEVTILPAVAGGQQNNSAASSAPARIPCPRLRLGHFPVLPRPGAAGSGSNALAS